MARWIVLMIVVGLSGAAPAAAQAGAGVEARMRAFLHELRDDRPAELEPFLPRRGTVTWVLTTRSPGREPVVGRWRFEPSQVVEAMDHDGPLCETFSPGGDAIVVGTLMHQILTRPGPWHRAGPRRFVPPRAPAGSPVFVEWRREDGRWVISAFGHERIAGPRLVGRERNQVVRDAGPGPFAGPLPPDTYAANRPWYAQHEPLRVDGGALDKYGPPRLLAPHELRRYGFVDGVPVYVEAGSTGRPEVVYLPVAPDGSYQPYQDMIGTGCA